MWTFEHVEETTVPREKIWALWADPENWTVWDDGLEWVKTEGPFEAGTSGELKPKGGPAVKFEFVAVIENEGFVDVTKLPLARMRMTHSLDDGEDGKLLMSQRVEISGLMQPLFAKLIGSGMKTDMPVAMRSLLTKAGA